MNEIPYDQEVIHIPHVVDYAQLVRKAFLQGSIIIWVTLRHAILAQLIQIAPGIVSLRHLVLRQLCHAKLDLNVAALRDLMGVIDGFLGVWKQRPHLFLRLHIVLAALVTHTVLIRHLLAGLDTQQNVVSCRILCQNVMNIVGCHQIHGKLPAHAHQALVYHFLGGNSVVLQLQKEVAFSKDLFIMPCRPAGLLVHAPGQIALHLARQAGA